MSKVQLFKVTFDTNSSNLKINDIKIVLVELEHDDKNYIKNIKCNNQTFRSKNHRKLSTKNEKFNLLKRHFDIDSIESFHSDSGLIHAYFKHETIIAFSKDVSSTSNQNDQKGNNDSRPKSDRKRRIKINISDSFDNAEYSKETKIAKLSDPTTLSDGSASSELIVEGHENNVLDATKFAEQNKAASTSFEDTFFERIKDNDISFIENNIEMFNILQDRMPIEVKLPLFTRFKDKVGMVYDSSKLSIQATVKDAEKQQVHKRSYKDIEKTQKIYHPSEISIDTSSNEKTLDEKYEDKNSRKLNSEEWLDDKHMNDYLEKLRKTYNGRINGLYDPTVLKANQTQPIENNAIIVHNTGNHWLTLSNINCPDADLTLYDSLYDSQHVDALKELLVKLFPTQKSLKIKIPKIQQQKGTNDCGLYSLAIAHDLCNGNDPSKIIYKQQEMRSHYNNCIQTTNLTNQKIKCFPRQKNDLKNIQIEYIEFSLLKDSSIDIQTETSIDGDLELPIDPDDFKFFVATGVLESHPEEYVN